MHQRAAFFVDLDAPHPIRHRISEILLQETLFVDAAGEPLHVERPSLEVRQHRVGHRAVVVDKIALGDPFFRGRAGKQHPVPMGDLNLNARHQRVSRTTSPGSLSVRRPW